MIEIFKFFAIFRNLLMFVVSSSRSMRWGLFDQSLQKNKMCRNVCLECSQKQFDVNTMNKRRKKKYLINFIRFVFIWVTRKFFDLIKSLCNFILFDVIFFISVSQTLRRFFAWYALHMFLHFLKKSLMRALFERTTSSFSSADNLTCIVCVHLIFRAVDVSSVLRRYQAHRDSIIYLVTIWRRSKKWERKNENVRANKSSSFILAY